MMKVMNSDWILLHSQNVGHTLSHLSGAGVRAGCQQVEWKCGSWAGSTPKGAAAAQCSRDSSAGLVCALL